MKDYNICIEAFIRWEQLTKRSFQTMDFESPDDLHKLLYCAYVVNDPTEIPTCEVFCKAIESNKKLYSKAIKALVRYNSVVAQFTTTTPADTPAVEAGQETPTLGEAVARLIVQGGVDARYAMREMTMEDMLLLLKALDDKQRQEAEMHRLWTYITVAPHIDQKKTPTPQKLYPFAWESTQIKKAEKITDADKADFEAFMRGTN